MTPILNVLLAEDPTRAPVRPFLREIPTVAIVAEATDGRVALPLIAAHQPDVAVVDTALPGLNGFDVAERASREHPRTRVLVVSTCCYRIPRRSDAMKSSSNWGQPTKDTSFEPLNTGTLSANDIPNTITAPC